MIKTIVPLGHDHDRAAFSCGVPDIDAYLLAYNLDLKTPSSRIYVAVDDAYQILGYYSLRPALWEVKGKHNKIVGSSFELELAMIGVTTALQGKGVVGNALVFDAFQKTLRVSSTVGGIERLWVGPRNERCKTFYGNAGFTKADNSKRMFITVSEIDDALTGPNPAA